MKTLLVALNAKFVHSNLALRYIKEYSHMHAIEIYETTINDGFMEAAMQIVEKKPDVVGFSCYLWNVEMAVKISGIIKEVLPKALIVFGGPEVSFNGSDYLKEHGHIDFVISGEGEITFRELLDTLSEKGDGFAHIQGLSFRSETHIVENQRRPSIENLDDIPFPYRSELPGKILYYEASRGCPFSCTYCLSGSLGAIRFFSLDRVKSDLGRLIDAKVELVKFVDRTFNASKRFAMEIWRFLIEHASDTKFHFEIAADLLDEESLALLAKAPKDLFQFEIGVQSTNPTVLENINRRMDFDKVRSNLVKLGHMGNIHCHLDLIAGLPGENLGSFIQSFEDCMAMGPDVLQLGFLKVLKGTAVHGQREAYGIQYMKYPNYHVLYTKDMSFEEIRGLMKFEKVFEIFYNSGIFNTTIRFVMGLEENSYAWFMGFAQYLGDNGFFVRSFDLKDKFRLLYEYLTSSQVFMQRLEQQLNAEAEPDCRGADQAVLVIRDLMVHDYILNTKKASIPDFLRRESTAAHKEAISSNKQMISAFFNGMDIKKLFHMPVSCKIIKHQSGDSIYMEEGLLVCNPVTSEYCYL